MTDAKYNFTKITDMPVRSPEHLPNGEQAYRRGYYQGYFQGVEDAKKHRAERLFQHLYGTLFRWRYNTRTNKIVSPPQIPQKHHAAAKSTQTVH